MFLRYCFVIYWSIRYSITSNLKLIDKFMQIMYNMHISLMIPSYFKVWNSKLLFSFFSLFSIHISNYLTDYERIDEENASSYHASNSRAQDCKEDLYTESRDHPDYDFNFHDYRSSLNKIFFREDTFLKRLVQWIFPICCYLCHIKRKVI